MKTVDLSPAMVEAIQEMQEDASTLSFILQRVNTFILKLDTEGQNELALKSLQCVKDIMYVQECINAFIPKDEQP